MEKVTTVMLLALLGLNGFGTWQVTEVGREAEEQMIKVGPALEVLGNLNETLERFNETAAATAREAFNASTEVLAKAVADELARSLGTTPEALREDFPRLLGLAKTLEGLDAEEVRALAALSRSFEGVDPMELREVVVFWRSLKTSNAENPLEPTPEVRLSAGSTVSALSVKLPPESAHRGSKRLAVLESGEAYQGSSPESSQSSTSVQNQTEVATEPSDGESEEDACPPGTPSGGLPGGPPERIDGECNGATYHCELDHSLSTPPVEWVYRCSASGYQGTPPREFTGSYNGINFRCTRDNGLSTGSEFVYRCRAS